LRSFEKERRLGLGKGGRTTALFFGISYSRLGAVSSRNEKQEGVVGDCIDEGERIKKCYYVRDEGAS